MADIEVGDLVARISFDDTGLNKSMAEINRQMKLVESEFQKASSGLQAYGSEEEKLKAKTNSLNQQMQLQQQKINNLNQAFQKSAQEKGLDAKQTQDLATKLNKAQSEYNKLDSELKQTTSALKEQQTQLSGLQKAWAESMYQARQSMGNAFEQMKKVGAGITAVGAGIAAGLGVAVKGAADFEQGMANAYAVMDPEEVTKFRGELKQLALQLGADTKYSATEAAQGIEELIKAGVKVQDVLNGGLKGALSLATAGELELADAAEIASTALNAFRDDHLSVQQAADILAGAANASATSVSEMKFGLSQAAAVASAVGTTFQDTSTTLAVFAQNGLKGSDAGTSLKTMLMRLTPTTTEAYEAFDELGLITFQTSDALEYLTKNGIKPASTQTKDVVDALMTYAAKSVGAKVGTDKANKAFRDMAFQVGALSSAFYDANGDLKSMAEVSEILKNAMSGLTSEQRQVYMNTMFGSDAIRAANILYKEGADGVNEMWEAMSKITADQVAAQKLDTFKGAIEQLNGAVETAKISIGDALLPVLRFLTEAIQKVVDGFNGLPESAKQFIAIGGSIAATLALITGPLLILIGFIPQIVAGFTMVGTVFSTLGPVFAALTGPIGIVIGAIGGLIAIFVTLYKKNEDFRNGVNEIWNNIKETFNNVLSSIKTIVSNIMSEVVEFFQSQLGEIKEFWDKNGKDIMTIVKVFLEGIKANIKITMGVIKGIFQAVWPVIQAIVKVAWETIKLTIGTVIDVLKRMISAWLKLLKGDWKGAWEEVKGIFTDTWDNIVQFFKNIDLREIGKNIMQGLTNGITSMKDSVVNAAKDVANSIGDSVKDFFGIHSPSRLMMAYGEFISEGLAIGMKNKLKTVIDGAKAIASGASNMIKKALDGKSTSKSAAKTASKTGEKTGKAYAAGVSKGISSGMSKGVSKSLSKGTSSNKSSGKSSNKKTAEELAKEAFEANKKWIDERKYYNQLTLQQELEVWQKISKKYKAGTDQRKEADREVYRVKKEILKAQEEAEKKSFDKSKAWIESRKELSKLSLTEELTAWERLQSRYKAGSEERITADKQVMAVRQEIYNQLKSASDDYLAKVKEVNENVAAEEQRLNEAYQQAVDSRAQSIYSFAGLFDEIELKSEVTGQKLVENLRGQIDVMTKWSEALRQLAARGVDDGLLAELRDMGPKAAAEIMALNSLTDSELSQYEELWRTKNQMARTQATKELEGMRLDTLAQIKTLKDQAAVELDGLQKQFIAKITSIRTGTKNEFNAMTASMPEIGKQIVNGLMAGIDQMTGPLKNKVAQLSKSVSDTIKSTLKIKSPSRVTMGLGEFVTEGLAVGITNAKRSAVQSAKDLSGAVTNALAMQLTPGVTAGSFGDVNAQGTSGQVVNNYNLTGMFAGANFNVRSDNDIKVLAQELGGVITQKSRGLGGA